MSAHLDPIFESPLVDSVMRAIFQFMTSRRDIAGVYGVKAPQRRYESGLGSSRATESLGCLNKPKFCDGA